MLAPDEKSPPADEDDDEDEDEFEDEDREDSAAAEAEVEVAEEDAVDAAGIESHSFDEVRLSLRGGRCRDADADSRADMEVESDGSGGAVGWRGAGGGCDGFGSVGRGRVARGSVEGFGASDNEDDDDAVLALEPAPELEERTEKAEARSADARSNDRRR
jgi:hypothetical protein